MNSSLCNNVLTVKMLANQMLLVGYIHQTIQSGRLLLMNGGSIEFIPAVVFPYNVLAPSYQLSVSKFPLLQILVSCQYGHVSDV